ncbi:hypothetical protein UK23_29240 [Lentzea aerocolonigenes]|uniref:DUF4253 domain-containing protein n=1 Tax=Lentzea aerocolonigenes TaxID=68170 RepID=A0A0F0GPI4_LENAE|nr:hypothetical protein [Lentzea aerocolonigenes]KJK44471.1 hypothetical protein UK23_29240 [Lentzea aerocolonigenes]
MESATLHTVARRYLMSRNDKLHAEYADVQKHTRRMTGAPGNYADEEKRIYPRYNVVDAMLREVERLDPDDLPPPARLATALATAASTAQSVFTTNLGPIEAEATAAERELFRRAIKGWLAAPDPQVEPLPYRRVLSDEEAEGWRRRLEQRWGFERNMTEWHPIIGDVPEGVIALNSAAVWDGPGTELVRAALRDMGLRRVIEIREHGDPGSLLDLDAFEPTYTGAEGIWTDETLEWVAYASHEASVAFAGTLADRLRSSWPDLDDWAWAPWWDQPAK